MLTKRTLTPICKSFKRTNYVQSNIVVIYQHDYTIISCCNQRITSKVSTTELFYFVLER